jgi:hypothetical protein
MEIIKNSIIFIIILKVSFVHSQSQNQIVCFCKNRLVFNDGLYCLAYDYDNHFITEYDPCYRHCYNYRCRIIEYKLSEYTLEIIGYKTNYYFPTKSECLKECLKLVDENIEIDIFCKANFVPCIQGEIVQSVNANKQNLNEKNELINTALSDECYTPTGDDCSWYRNCVAKRYDCTGVIKNSFHGIIDGGVGETAFSPFSESHNYAIDYGEKFCKLYEDNYDSFSNEGKLWVDKVRKCLQVKLAPYIKPESDVTCEELEKIAFESHSPCYLEPDGISGESSGICALGLKDWIQVFFTIKSAFFSEFSESIKGFFEVCIQGCGINLLEIYDDETLSLLGYMNRPIDFKKKR